MVVKIKEKPSEVTIKLFRCKKCLYEWYPIVSGDGIVREPKMCPHCHQDWRREKLRNKKL